MINEMHPKTRKSIISLVKPYRLNTPQHKTDVNWNKFEIKFMGGKTTNEFSLINEAKLKTQINDEIISTCYPWGGDYRSANNCIYGEYNINKMNTIVYDLSGLKLNNANSICNNISGATLIKVFEKYILSETNGRIIGTVGDGAEMNDKTICKTMAEYMKKNIYDLEIFKNILRQIYVPIYQLSVMTICKTGLTYYEKFGYMSCYNKKKRGAYNSIEKLDYCEQFEIFLGFIKKRLDLLNININELLKTKATLSNTKNIKLVSITEGQNMPYATILKRIAKLLKSNIPSIKHILNELRPDIKFEINRIVDIYRLMANRCYQIPN